MLYIMISRVKIHLSKDNVWSTLTQCIMNFGFFLMVC